MLLVGFDTARSVVALVDEDERGSEKGQRYETWLLEQVSRVR